MTSFGRVAMFRVYLGTLMLLFVAGVTRGQERPAARWTLEERLERRNDPVDAAHRAYVNAMRMTPGPRKPPNFVISGADDPELFLPFELMNMLLDSTKDRSEAYRERVFDPVLADFHWDRDRFWSALADSGAHYFRLNSASAKASSDDALSREICGARAAAHEEMRKRYPRFDEFLYAAVAPNRTLVSDDILSASWLVWLEGGCK
jgi:hypothetical protein